MAQHKEGMVNKTGGDTTNSVGPCPAPPSRYSLLWNCCHMDSNAEGLNAIALLHKHLPNLPGSTNARVFTPLLLTQWDLTKPSLGEQEHLISIVLVREQSIWRTCTQQFTPSAAVLLCTMHFCPEKQAIRKFIQRNKNPNPSQTCPASGKGCTDENAFPECATFVSSTSTALVTASTTGERNVGSSGRFPESASTQEPGFQQPKQRCAWGV